MFSRWLEALKEVSAEREGRFREVLRELCSESLAVALFGSRARGDHTPLSDWDLLAIVASGEYRVEARDIGQVVWLPLDKVDNVLGTSMIILDAVMDGKLLCGDPRVLDEVKTKVREYIERMNLIRTRSGWFPRSALEDSKSRS
ncbi:nucleotidyltransferase domain-containing protein [Vulcanisaeta thermophila]|uniref:nucleotidyltransferase domain-containing protein n=1 Tax=Vulcanisaeta thermophila TaxID=867917 RepID=UPI0008538A95|nr:nucleotidyltransferase domain-containing protein [Vulcanisaeta thermophila]